jgi:tetratricopeptide (TPR) repeat protein
MKRSLCLWSLGFLTLCSVSLHAESTEPFLRFADHLFAAGDYYRAITEYERFSFSAPDHPQAPRAGLMIAMSYFKGRKWEPAAERFVRLKENYAGQEVGRAALLMLAETYFAMGRYAEAEPHFTAYAEAFPAGEHADRARIKAGVCLLRLGQQEWARESFAGVATNVAAELRDVVREFEQVPRKSPGLAAGLSAAMPGAGQLYIRRPHDALVAFLVNGLLIWGAVEAFERDEQVAGAFIAVFEAGWYFGNIYNAANGAHKFNARASDAFLDRLQIRLGVLGDPRVSERPLPGIGVGASF